MSATVGDVVGTIVVIGTEGAVVEGAVVDACADAIDVVDVGDGTDAPLGVVIDGDV